MSNRTLAGVWIDLKKAVVVVLNGETSNIETYESDIDTRERIEGDNDHSGRFGGQHIDDEKHKENRLNELKKAYLRHVTDQLHDHHQIVVFGPAGMKQELKKEIRRHHVMDEIKVDVKSADHLTDNQIIAWVKDYYSAI
jgi:RNA-binding protein YhbY